ncbi:WD40-repeat-containing domain protein [Staphylotrichum tortipilum]|uniref:WD40-repeat-containing domain protein n=1 Tax=Staphylotrichum tortipilum TaxID=2831512 RepID=A0AAN6MN90_9PEZI|nr:WD40-repeat-containing domain protein [Staphylotrichum longicolle]
MPPSSHRNPEEDDSEPEMIDEDDAQEVLEGEDGDGDIPMGSDDEGSDELVLHNDSIAYFDAHNDSVFAIAQHPLFPNLVATGGSEGDADDAPGKGYVVDTSAAASRPVLPPSYNAAADSRQENTALQPLFAIDGHTDSINALAFTLPRGDFLVSGGMDGRLRVYAVAASASGARFKFLAESQETEEVNWLAPCPSPDHPNTVALGASDGSVWVFTLDPADAANPIQIVQSYFLHTGPCTAGTWTPDGLLLATVSEDSSLHVFDVWGAAAAKSLVTDNGQTVVSLTDVDQRFAVDGGLYSVAVSPSGGLLAAGGALGAIRIVSLPRLSQQPQQQQTSSRQQQSQQQAAGTILASLAVQSDSIESLAFSPTTPLLAAGSVDGSIAVYDPARSFALRKHLKGAHEGESVVKVDFVRNPPTAAEQGWLLTSCGLDGVVRRWDLRGAATAAGGGAAALVREWRGHRGGGEGGGVLGFVQGETGERLVTAGDDGVVLVFEA